MKICNFLHTTIFCIFLIKCSINQTLQSFEYTKSEIKDLVKAYEEEIKKSREVSDGEHFIDTFVVVDDNETLSEEPKEPILAIDVGGSYLKLGLIKISALSSYEFVKDVEHFKIVKNELGYTDLFDWISEKCLKYLEGYGNNHKIAMTFSYPIKHEGVKKGKILSMGKDFPFKPIDIEKCGDPSILLQEALKKQGITATVDSLLNDATATLLASYYIYRNTSLGIVLGTGTNGAFIEDADKNGKRRVLNTEWGSFNHEKLKKTEHDNKIETEIRNEKKVFNCLDCMIGGYKIIELLNRATGNKYQFTLEDVIQITKNLKRECEDEPENIINGSHVAADEKTNAVKVIKTRSMKILASLCIAVIRSVSTRAILRFSLNGSILSNEYDRNVFTKEMAEIKNLYDDLNDVLINYVFIDDSSLIGSAFVAAYNSS